MRGRWGIRSVRGAVVGGVVAFAMGPAPASVAVSRGVPQLAVAWQQSCVMCHSVTVIDGVVYAADGAAGVLNGGAFVSTVHAYDAVTGANRWSHSLGFVMRSRVVGTTRDLALIDLGQPNGVSVLVALDRTSGVERWRSNAAAGASRSTLAAQGVILALDRAGSQFSVTRYDDSGHAKWRYVAAENPGGITATRGTVYVFGATFVPPGQQIDSLVELDERNGAPLRRFEFSGESSVPFQQPVVVGNLVYASQYAFGVGSGHGAVAIDATTGAIVWTVRGTTRVRVANGVAVIASFFRTSSADNSLDAVDASTGVDMWSVALANGAADGPALTTSSLFTTNNAALEERGLHDGVVTSRYDDPAGGTLSEPKVARGFVYVVSATQLLAFAAA